MYSLNESSFKQVEAYLVEMLNTNEKELSWQLSETSVRRFAYLIRQGMFVAEKLEKGPLANLRKKWIITERGNKVIARQRFSDKVIPIGIHEKTFRGLHTVSMVISTVIDNNNLTVLSFPDAEFDEIDIAMLQKWCKLKKYEFDERTKEIRKWLLTETETKQLENQSN